MSKLLATIEVPKFITRVQTAKQRRAVYFKKNKKGEWKPRNPSKTLQKKIDKGIYSVKNNFILDENGQREVANRTVAGKPRYEVLSGNKLLSGFASPFTRAKLVTGLKDFYRPFVQEHFLKHGQISTFPLRITWDIYTTVEDSPNWDLFNLFFYYKYFEDSLHEKTTEDNKIYYKNKPLNPLIPDDNVKYITWGPGPKLIPVDDWENRKFIFRIYHDNRPEFNRKPWV